LFFIGFDLFTSVTVRLKGRSALGSPPAVMCLIDVGRFGLLF